MNTTKKITVVLAVMVVAAMAAPAVMGADPTYTVSVTLGQSTTTTVTDATFGLVLQDTANTITDSLTLTNTGDWDAAVKAKCSSQTVDAGAAEYGLIGSTDVAGTPVYIGGNNLKLGATGTLIVLTNNGADAIIDDGTGANKVPKKAGADGTVKYDAELTVPAGQTVDLYSGLVTLTFSNA